LLFLRKLLNLKVNALPNENGLAETELTDHASPIWEISLARSTELHWSQKQQDFSNVAISAMVSSWQDVYFFGR